LIARTLVFAAVLIAFSSGAAGAAVDRGEILVDGFVNDVVTFSGDFEQSLIDPEGRILEVTKGTLEIQRPGRFRWVYSEPYEQCLVADGLNIWSYDVDLEQVTVKPQAEALANTPALLLGGSSDAMAQFRFDGSFDENGLTWVRLVPVDADSGFKRMELGFNGTQLAQMVFFDNLEQTTFIALDHVAVNEPIDAARFEFKVPDGVDVVGEPATPMPTAD